MPLSALQKTSGDELAHDRRARGVAQRELATEWGTTPQYVAAIEKLANVGPALVAKYREKLDAAWRCRISRELYS